MKKTSLVSLAVAGLLSGYLMAAPSMHPSKGDFNGCKGKDSCKGKKAKHDCKGKDSCKGKKAKHDCKGKDSCKGLKGKFSEVHGCKGKNMCKGLGGCKISAKEKQTAAKALGWDAKKVKNLKGNECAGHNECKGLGGCKVDKKKFASLKEAQKKEMKVKKEEMKKAVKN